MSNTAAHLVDRVLPEVPTRQLEPDSDEREREAAALASQRAWFRCRPSTVP